jgi:uncharacterized protein
MTLHWTLLFAGLLGLLHFALTLWVIVRRAQTGISFGDGGDMAMLRRIRAHANFAETTPLALLLMALLEYKGLGTTALLSLGTALVLGRVLNASSILTNNAAWSRRGGMVLSLAVISIEAVLCLWLFFT